MKMSKIAKKCGRCRHWWRHVVKNILHLPVEQSWSGFYVIIGRLFDGSSSKNANFWYFQSLYKQFWLLQGWLPKQTKYNYAKQVFIFTNVSEYWSPRSFNGVWLVSVYAKSWIWKNKTIFYFFSLICIFEGLILL